ncbi:hypothetical protein [uncultured Desulfovibrio sp.]|jgi:hypothetical protein|uniref:hypothetical protein n=1 Tax=uncultured Desulfovibrio sp. TaxID=167968 RepID=UPI0020503AD6|nr:hypothetical protein [uncultured Desulfovibrio sp.]DAF34387.1 MAG TPA: virion protein [Bacteriophage sp.]
MALSTKGLVAPDSVSSLDVSRIAPSSGTAAPMWEVGDPAAVAMAGLQKSAERFADTYDDVQVGDFIMRQKKKLDDLYDNPDTGLFATRKGDAAKGMYQESKDTFKAIWDEDAKQQLSERQRQLASKPLQAMFMDYAHRIGSHETTQLMNAQIERAENTISTARDLVAAGKVDMETLGSALANIEIATAAQGKMLGWDADTVARKQKEAFGSAIIKGSAAIAATNPTMAIGVLNKYRGFISDADYQASLAVLDEKAREFKKQHYLELVASGQKEEAESFLRNNAPQGMSFSGNTIAEIFHNPLNLKQAGANSGTRADYRQFDDDAEGFRAAAAQLRLYQNRDGLTTPRQFIGKWAPAYENDLAKYYQTVAKATGLDLDKPLDLNDPQNVALLMKGMAIAESPLGKKYSAVDIAGFLQGKPSPKISAQTGIEQEPAGYKPGRGMLKPSEVMTLLKQGREMFGRQQEDAAFKFVADMPKAKALELLASPDGQNRLGIDAKQAVAVSNMLNTHWTHKNAAEKRAREDYDRDALTEAVNLAFGIGGSQADPDAAYRMIRDDPNIDGKTKLETLKALQNGTLDTDDPSFVIDIKNRIAREQPVTEADIARGVATGKLSFATKEKLIKLQETAQGPQGALIKYAFKALDGAFKKSMLADGTPEQALAHFAAQRELQDAIEQAQADGNLLDILNPQSKNYILPGIMQRHQLTMSDQVNAIRNKMSAQSGSGANQKNPQRPPLSEFDVVHNIGGTK